MKKNIIKFSLFEKADIGIEKDEITTTVKFLKKLQSDEFVLYVKLWNFHWNVVAKDFDPVHKFLNKLYDKFFDRIDETAERIRQLGERPIGSIKGFLDKTSLEDYAQDDEIPSVPKMFKIITEDYNVIIKNIREFLKEEKTDNGTTNYLEDLIMNLEKDVWMVRSHIEDLDEINEEEEKENEEEKEEQNI